jgi:O-antigen/teichoic acid export membrane protein
LLPQALLSKTASDQLKYASTYLKSGAVVCGAMLLLTWLAAPLTAPLFAHDMRAAAGIFRILGAAAIILLVLNPIQFLLYSMNRPDLSTASDALITVLFAALAALLTPRYGASGTAWGLFVSQTSIKVITAWGIVRYLKGAIARQNAAELAPEYSGLT